MGLQRRMMRAGRVVGGVLWRRARHGPKFPNWSVTYELVIAYLREAFRYYDGPIEGVRKRMDAGGQRELQRGRVHWQRGELAGVAVEWAEPPTHGTHLVVYVHGGGYAFGSASSHRRLVASLAVGAHVRVIVPEYRLAPEHPCPAALEDMTALIRHLVHERGVEPGAITLVGDSAGGGLILATLQALRDGGGPLPRDGILLSPWVDLTLAGASYDAFEDHDYLGSRQSLRHFADMYRGELSADDPRVSPLRGDLGKLPPLLVLAGGGEILLDDSRALARGVEASGGDIELHVEPGEVHVYPVFDGLSEGGTRGMRQLVSRVRDFRTLKFV